METSGREGSNINCKKFYCKYWLFWTVMLLYQGYIVMWQEGSIFFQRRICIVLLLNFVKIHLMSSKSMRTYALAPDYANFLFIVQAKKTTTNTEHH